MAAATYSKPKSLTAAFVSTVKEPGKYHDGKGMGLFLAVKPTGGRFWVQRIVIRGKRRELGLGSPPCRDTHRSASIAMFWPDPTMFHECWAASPMANEKLLLVSKR
jgi:hypothetical protein